MIWDLPGANTPNNPAKTYFQDKLLCAYNGLLLVSGDTFLESDLEVLRQAQHYGIPVALVRTKSDMHIYNMVYSEEIEPEAAERYCSLLSEYGMPMHLGFLHIINDDMTLMCSWPPW